MAHSSQRDLRKYAWFCPTIVPLAPTYGCFQWHTAAYGCPEYDNSPGPVIPGQGLFSLWWQVLGSNQRRLSRRFYSVHAVMSKYAPELWKCSIVVT
jgi:hypothetical protein